MNSAASCAGVCSDYRKTAHFQCQSGSLCDRHVNDHEPAKCAGIIRNCQDIDDSDVNICETVSKNPDDAMPQRKHNDGMRYILVFLYFTKHICIYVYRVNQIVDITISNTVTVE